MCQVICCVIAKVSNASLFRTHFEENSGKSKETSHFTKARLILEYARAVLNPHTPISVNQIERRGNDVAGLVSGKLGLYKNLSNIEEQPDFETLGVGRKHFRLSLFRNIY